MKKFILAALLCISVNGFAQLIQVGPQFSTNITSLNSDNFSSKSSGTGVGFAAFARVNLLMFYGQAEFEYELSGTDATLIAGFKIIPLGKLGNVRVFAGYNWKNYSDIKVSNDLNPIALEKNNHSILGGVGVDLWRFTLDYRYLGGLTDIDSSEGDIKTRVSTVSLGFKFL